MIFDKILAGALALALLAIGLMSWRIDHVKAALEAAQTRAVAAETRLAAAAHNDTIAVKVADTRRQMRADVRTITQEIANAPPSDDAPLSPVMLRALEQLRALHARYFPAADPGGTAPLRRPDSAPAGDHNGKAASPMADAGSGEWLGLRVRDEQTGRLALAREGDRPQIASFATFNPAITKIHSDRVVANVEDLTDTVLGEARPHNPVPAADIGRSFFLSEDHASPSVL